MSNTKNSPKGVSCCYLTRLAVFEGIELDDETEDWEGNTSTSVNGVNHTSIQLVTVVRTNVQVVAVFLEVIANTWVEDSNVLLLTISRP